MSVRRAFAPALVLALTAPPVLAADEPAALPAPSARALPKAALRSKVVMLSGADAEFPDAARAAGHHGKVVFSVLIGADGQLKESTLKQSSRSDLLDASAKAALARAQFKPAIGEDGNPIEFRGDLPYSFYKWQSVGAVSGFATYTCADFTVDEDWWDSVAPSENGKTQDDTLQKMLLGARVLLQPGGLASGGVKGFTAMMAAHKAEWNAARTACRAKPAMLFVDTLEPKERTLLLKMPEFDKRLTDLRKDK